jgi:organic radical activating enzyme
MEYALAPQGVYWSHQGEGHLRGFGMVFIRLAGCSVGCSQCDTDYTVKQKEKARTIAWLANNVTSPKVKDRWAWITGGEPGDFSLTPLINELRAERFSVAVATSGHKRLIPPVEWLSVSPHSVTAFRQTYGNEIKLVDGLNGLDLEEFIRAYPDDTTDFFYRYVQPMSTNGVEDPASLERCKRFLLHHPNWALSRQDHNIWSVQ